MVAYSFKAQFEPRVRTGQKRQTIRAKRKRHARPGEELQLYFAQRTKQCRLIGRATCESVTPISIDLENNVIAIVGRKPITTPRTLDAFARRDGFDSFFGLKHFWAREHAAIKQWSGVLITWKDFR